MSEKRLEKQCEGIIPTHAPSFKTKDIKALVSSSELIRPK